MPKSIAHRNELLNLIYRATAIADFADNDATSPATSIYVALHTADPGDSGAQNASEIAYSSYDRVAVARSGSGWNAASNGMLDNVAEIAFPQCGASGATAFFWSTGKGSSGATAILHRGPIGSAIGAFVCEADDDTIVCKGHGLLADDRVAFLAAPGTALPTGITSGVVYFVRSTGLTTDAFTVSTTQGGASVAVTVDGAGLALKVTPRVISDGVTPRFAAGALDIVEG